MNRSPASYHRKRTRLLPAMVATVFVVVMLCFVWMGFRVASSPAQFRQSTILVGESVHIVSWDAKREHVVLVDLPGTAVIEGTHGYGKYPLFSLLKLDTIDRHDGKVFTESLSDALGLPLLGVAQLSSDAPKEGSVELLRHAFSWKSLFDVKKHHVVSWGTWASWVLATRSLKADQVETINAKQVLVDQSQPDGSTISILDAQRFDYLYGNLFTDTRIRTEGVTVSVYNTTGVPTIGQRAARILAQLGVSVVTVGNDETAIANCVLEGTKTSLRSYTAKFIRSYFDCETKQNEEVSGTSDLSLRLGTEYASIFAPRK